jgi:hypothetical protein
LSLFSLCFNYRPRSTESPVDAVASVVLGILAAAYGTHIRVRRFEGYVTWCNLFLTLVGDSSLGKTPIFRHVAAVIEEIERLLQEEAAEKVRDARTRITRLEIERDVLIKQKKAGRAKNFDDGLRALDDEAYRVDRITRGRNQVDEARLTIVGGTQSAVMRDVHKRPELTDRGFVARHLFCKVESTFVEGRPEPVPGDLRDAYTETIRDLGLAYRRTPESIELSLTLPPTLEQAYGPEALRDAVRVELDHQEQLARREVKRRGWRVLGAERVRRLSPYRRATSFEPLRGRNPTFAVGRGQRKMFFEAVAELRAFRRAYRQALEQWRAGLRDVVFPLGTWCMCQVHGVVVRN